MESIYLCHVLKVHMCVSGGGYIHTQGSDTYTSGMHITENLWLLLLLLAHCRAYRWIPNGLGVGVGVGRV